MQFDFVTCPHCGLLCDDLSVEVNDLVVQLKTPAYPLCEKAFDDASLDHKNLPSPLIDNKPSTLQQAVNVAANLLDKSRQPLISGMIGDIQTCRNAIELGEKLGAVVDHVNGSRMRASSAMMQRLGEVKTTLSEVRNRADCIVVFGSNVLNKFPRLYDRILSPSQSLSGDNTLTKKIIVLDHSEKGAAPQKLTQDGINHLHLKVPSLDSIVHRLLNVINNPINSRVEVDDATRLLIDLHQTISKSHYTTFIWSTSEFNLETIEHTLQAMTQIIKKLMEKIRCVGLPLSGSKAEITANHVATWQTGVPLPVAFMSGAPVHDPNLYSSMKMLQNKEADALIWIATYNPNDIPPNSDVPTIVIGHPKMQCVPHADVFIPTGIPGIDHRGLACRTDSVATLPLKSLRDSKLPAASDVIQQLTQILG